MTTTTTAALPTVAEVMEKLQAKHGFEHALYLAFAAGRHGEVTYEEWVDNLRTNTYLGGERARRKRKAFHRKKT